MGVTCANMNVLPLGSYDILIGMDWTGEHRENLDRYNKTFECLDEKGNLRVVKGILKVTSSTQISAMQPRKFCGKGFKMCAARVLEAMMLLGWRDFRAYLDIDIGSFYLFKKNTKTQSRI